MQNARIDDSFLEDLLNRIGEGLIEGVRQEMERRKRLGIPICIDRDGKVEIVMPDSTRVSTNSLPTE